MNSKLIFLATAWAVAMSGLSAETGTVTGGAPVSNGAASSKFDFPAIQSHRVLPSPRFKVVPLPVGLVPYGLGDNGVVLLMDSATGWVRWQKGSSGAIQLGRIQSLSKQGDILREFPDGTYALEKADGQLTPLTVDGGPYPSANIVGFSARFGVGFLTSGDAGPSRSSLPVRWDFGGGHQALASVASGDFTPFQPTDVNERGDYLARKYLPYADGGGEFLGTSINGQYLEGLLGTDFNNRGSALLIDWNSSSGSVGPPLYWDGALHPLGDRPGFPASINDNDEILVDQDDGHAVLWRKTVNLDGQLSFEATDLGEATGLDIDYVVRINRDGMILLAAQTADGESNPFLLVPVTDALRVDFDRNGSIDPSVSFDNPDRELERRQLPWYFWVNDDDDSGEEDGTDIPGRGSNGQDEVVNGIRDLVDFFPVHLDIAGLLKTYAPDDPAVTYKLSQADGAANFLTTALTPQTAGEFLHNPVVADNLAHAAVSRVTAAGVPLDRAFLRGILSGNKGIILVEARQPTDQPLQLEVWRSGVRVEGISLPLRFAGVETMFRHKNLASAVHITPDTPDRPGAPNWPDELNSNKVFVFLHGYNVNQQQARGWQAEFFKRLWWSGSKAQFWGVTWYGSESQIPLAGFTPNYQVNVINAFGAAPELARFVTELHTAGKSEVDVAAHSLGNMVTSSAITDYHAPINRYFMINAAVAAEAYDGSEAQPDDGTAFMPHSEWNRERGGVYPPRLWATNWYKLFSTPGDARGRLTWRDRFPLSAGTAYYDFHSTGEEVLGYDTKNTPSLGGVLARELGAFLHFNLAANENQPNGYKAWVYQEQLKGRTITGKILGSTYGGWGFNIFHFKRQPGGYGKGPAMIPAVLSPSEAAALSPQLSDADLQAEPFFRPGSTRTKVSSWLPEAGGGRTFVTEKLGVLYATGSAEFASRHRDTLLARMIPSMSPPAGRVALKQLPVTNSFDMSSAEIRGVGQPWSPARLDNHWRHSDMRNIAYAYVDGLYRQIFISGRLNQNE